MTAFKEYLLKLVLCALLISLASAAAKGKRGEKAVALCGGCLLMLTAVKPLLRVNLSQLPDLMTGLSHSEKLAEAKRKNDALLQQMIEAQTAEWICEEAKAAGLVLEATVEAEAGEAGSFVPSRITLRGAWTAEQRERFSAYLEQTLSVPPERQNWGPP